jgi:hypothetical protein
MNEKESETYSWSLACKSSGSELEECICFDSLCVPDNKVDVDFVDMDSNNNIEPAAHKQMKEEQQVKTKK